MEFRLFLKSSHASWRQLIKVDRIDVCFILAGVNVIPMLKSATELIYMVVPSLPRKCPIMPGKISAVNATIMSPEIVERFKKIINSFTASLLPNGVYRGVIKYYTEEGSLAFLLYYHGEIYFRMNDDVF